MYLHTCGLYTGHGVEGDGDGLPSDSLSLTRDYLRSPRLAASHPLLPHSLPSPVPPARPPSLSQFLPPSATCSVMSIRGTTATALFFLTSSSIAPSSSWNSASLRTWCGTLSERGTC